MSKPVRFTLEIERVGPLSANSGHDCKIKSAVRFKVGRTLTEERNEVPH